jgi:hypothetical protein
VRTTLPTTHPSKTKKKPFQLGDPVLPVQKSTLGLAKEKTKKQNREGTKPAVLWLSL